MSRVPPGSGSSVHSSRSAPEKWAGSRIRTGAKVVDTVHPAQVLSPWCPAVGPHDPQFQMCPSHLMDLSWLRGPSPSSPPALRPPPPSSQSSAARPPGTPDLVRSCVPGVGPDQGEVGEAHGLVPDRGGPGARLTHKAAGLPRKRQQTGTVLSSRAPGPLPPPASCTSRDRRPAA